MFTESHFVFIANRQKPLTFVIGELLTLIGFERGLLGSCIGEIRKLTIPSSLTKLDPDNLSTGLMLYVPQDQTLVYHVEILDIDPTADEDDGF